MSPEYQRPQPPACRSCWKDVDWSNIVRVDRMIGYRVVERAYACPHCRALLEVACWQTNDSQGIRRLRF